MRLFVCACAAAALIGYSGCKPAIQMPSASMSATEQGKMEFKTLPRKTDASKPGA